MNRGMPVVAAVESRSQLPRRCCIRIAIQGVANVIGVLFVHAGEGETRKPLSGFDVERACVLRGSTHRQEQGQGITDQFHRLIL